MGVHPPAVGGDCRYPRGRTNRHSDPWFAGRARFTGRTGVGGRQGATDRLDRHESPSGCQAGASPGPWGGAGQYLDRRGRARSLRVEDQQLAKIGEAVTTHSLVAGQANPRGTRPLHRTRWGELRRAGMTWTGAGLPGWRGSNYHFPPFGVEGRALRGARHAKYWTRCSRASPIAGVVSITCVVGSCVPEVERHLCAVHYESVHCGSRDASAKLV